MSKTLLLTSSYEVVRFIGERKMLKLIFNGKVDIISEWKDNPIIWASGQMLYPSIVRLKESFKRTYYNASFTFSRKEIVKRDSATCQYCSEKLPPSKITIDHVIPKGQGGITSFTNCVVSCYPCNGRKANRTPEEAKMVLLKKPVYPTFSANYYSIETDGCWHNDWDTYIRGNNLA